MAWANGFNGVNQKGKRVHGEVIEKFCHQGEISYCPVQFFYDRCRLWVLYRYENCGRLCV